MNHDGEMQQRTEQALRTLTHATPPADMQARLKERFRVGQAEKIQRVAWPNIGWAAAAAMILFATCLALSHQRLEKNAVSIASVQHQPVKHPEMATNMPSIAPHNTSLPVAARPTKSQHVDASSPAHLETSVRPQTPPPLPLTNQERLLIALARTPSLAASIAVSEPVSDHGLGPNTLLESDAEQPVSLPPASLEFAPMPPQHFDPSPTGENR